MRGRELPLESTIACVWPQRRAAGRETRAEPSPEPTLETSRGSLGSDSGSDSGSGWGSEAQRATDREGTLVSVQSPEHLPNLFGFRYRREVFLLSDRSQSTTKVNSRIPGGPSSGYRIPHDSPAFG